MDALFETQQRLLTATDTVFQRYIYRDIAWNSRMLALVGPRGVGKTTLFLQHIKLHHSVEDTLYVSTDSTYFASHTLLELADRFYKNGGKNLFLDEIHKYARWSQELKEIYDSYPSLHIAFTGSSVLDITKGIADLSRRAPVYKMQGLSFREYLSMFHNVNVPAHSLADIIRNKISLPGVEHPLPFFADYLKKGYYPFGQDPAFSMEMEELINKTLEVDIPNYANMNMATVRKLKRLLAIIAQSVPFKPVHTSLADLTGISRNAIADHFILLERAGLIGQLRNATGGIRGLGKIEKMYLDNPNLLFVLAPENANVGNLRETFFLNQMRVNHDVINSKQADFTIDDLTFEVGGVGKKQKQIAGLKNAYIVKDDIEYGHGNVIPLWAFGLNY
ncbi:MAG: AAA family ATPase [Bacteroides sp.]|nr:AAA family ATPase [Bacteroides sp.]MCM1085706.1 AAA family ATPase [Bacteroides sp.]MCM1170230.1 AAA family ATPase [Bacteroides sp.]